MPPRSQHTPPPAAIQKPKRGRRVRQESIVGPTNSRPQSLTLALAQLLLAWYAHHQRTLPWRKQRDPYAIWVSEIMLQQTQVQTVRPYFERWLVAFPSVAALARASEAEVLQIWQGLGYYSRARSLHAGARKVLELGGKIPADLALLRALPGVGPYTAGAIASIAFGLNEPTVDGNIARVLTRLFALKGNLQRQPLKDQVWELARALLPHGHAGDFNQALMELGALCCTPKKPLCPQCPVRQHCQAQLQGDPTRYPEPIVRPKLTAIHSVAALAVRQKRVLVAQLASNAPRWGGLWVFPHVERSEREAPAEAAERALGHFTTLRCERALPLAELIHHVTRYRITLSLYRCDTLSGSLHAKDACTQVRWVVPDALALLPMPAPHRKLARQLSQDLNFEPSA